ncbi:MAG: chromate transporter [Bacteroidaceae bacterium]|nr:chromate transporter [Bacteroidaceae bacterium]
MNTNLLSMFLVFAKIGAFTLGGGYAMVPIMEKDIVDRHQWLTREEFMDVLIVAQSTPGLFAINMASHIGNKTMGVLGGIVASFGVALPSIVSILLIAMFFRAFKDNIYIEKIFMGVRPAVVALIAAPCFSMARAAKLSLSNLWIPVVSCLLITLFGVSPIWIILVAGLAGYLYGRFKTNS